MSEEQQPNQQKTQKEHLSELHDLIRNLIASSQEMSGLLQNSIQEKKTLTANFEAQIAQLKKDLSSSQAKEQSNIFRARAAEKEASDTKKQVASLQVEVDKVQKEREEDRRMAETEQRGLIDKLAQKEKELNSLRHRLRDLEWELD